jgi:hypothetical protein
MMRFAIAAGAVAALLVGPARAQTACNGLMGKDLPQAKVTSATDMAAGQIGACKIDVTADPSPNADIHVEVWIPTGSAWNGRYIQLGAGAIASGRLQATAALGYAVAMSDGGHTTDARRARLATTSTADIAGTLIVTYQGRPAK